MRQKIYLLLIFGLFIALCADRAHGLVEAARRGDTVKIEEILKSGISVNTHDSDGRTALHEAAATENVKLFKLLIAAGADIRATDNKGVTPEFIVLHARNNFALWAAMALSFPQRPASQDGPWTLTSAISHRQAGVVEMLLKLGVNPNAVDSNGDYPLDLAAQKGDSQIVQSLLSRGATVNLRNKTGSFPLHTAALNGNTEVVQLLLDEGAEIDCRVSGTGETPLFYAAAFGRAKTVELLLARGADKNIANKDGVTPLAAAWKADRQDTVICCGGGTVLISTTLGGAGEPYGMQIEIEPETERLVREEISAGHYRSVDELIKAGVEALRQKDTPKSLVQFFRESPFVGLELHFERDRDTGRDVAL